MNNSSENSPYIQEQRTLYLEKNAWMDTYYERVDPHTFYRELFPVGSFERKGHYEDGKGNLYLTKGSSEWYPCVAAHMDTVFDE